MPVDPAKKEKLWTSTLAFRRFREKHTRLSQLYWTEELARTALMSLLSGEPEDNRATDTIPSALLQRMLPETVGELRQALPYRAGLERMHLLVVCCAHLEAYLQDIIRLWVGALGHAKSEGNLDAVGQALARPVIRSSTVPEMLRYSSELVAIDFGDHLKRWQHAYGLRCAVAHGGTIATKKVARSLPELKLKSGDHLALSWDQLKEYLGSAHEMATLLDQKVSTRDVRALELRWTLEEWKADGTLPARRDLWKHVHEQLGLTIDNARKEAIERLLY